MRVTVIGTGYVGLVVGACLSSFGHHVTCVEKDREKLLQTQQGKVPFYEPGLEELLRNVMDQQQILFVPTIREGVQDSELILVTVGTPLGNYKMADLSDLHQVINELCTHLPGNTYLMIKSTIPVGTVDSLEQIIAEQLEANGSPYRLELLYCRDFLREGSAIQDFLHPDRIIVGTRNPEHV